MTKQTYSGNVVLRMTPELHAHIARIAEESGRSLNQVLIELVAGGSNFKLPKK
jgi:predicted HicB family RNase H-like nuclease